jgi:hypothetical protein
VQSVPEFVEIVGCAIGERLISLSPHILRGVELRRIRGKVVDAQARMALEERPNLPASVDAAAIPKQLHGTAQVAEQVMQERADVEAGEIAGATAEIERQGTAAWARPPTRCRPRSGRGGSGGAHTGSGRGVPRSGERWE